MAPKHNRVVLWLKVVSYITGGIENYPKLSGRDQWVDKIPILDY